jgi:hypothetical protein
VALPAGVAIIMIWGFGAAARNPIVEGYNVAANVAYRVPSGSDALVWLQDAGMPSSSALADPEPTRKQAELMSDPEFWDWSTTDGAETYLRFLIANPRLLLASVSHVIIDGGLRQESLVDRPKLRSVATPGPSFVWPDEASRYTLMLVLGATVTALALASERRLDRRWILPCLLAASSIPHAMLAYNASPLEIARHGVVLALVLVVSSWWALALAADSVLSRCAPLRSRSSAPTDTTTDLWAVPNGWAATSGKLIRALIRRVAAGGGEMPP